MRNPLGHATSAHTEVSPQKHVTIRPSRQKIFYYYCSASTAPINSNDNTTRGKRDADAGEESRSRIRTRERERETMWYSGANHIIPLFSIVDVIFALDNYCPLRITSPDLQTNEYQECLYLVRLLASSLTTHQILFVVVDANNDHGLLDSQECTKAVEKERQKDRKEDGATRGRRRRNIGDKTKCECHDST